MDERRRERKKTGGKRGKDLNPPKSMHHSER